MFKGGTACGRTDYKFKKIKYIKIKKGKKVKSWFKRIVSIIYVKNQYYNNKKNNI